MTRPTIISAQTAPIMIVALLVMAALTTATPRVMANTVAPPLAIVGPDTLTTTDLKIELGIMVNQKEGGATAALPAPDQVLRRLIQNQLVVQEGYRMGLHEEFVVANQVFEFVRHKTMSALLDSVAGAVPADAADRHEKRRLAVGDYLADLRERFHVTVDSTLLASLDYGSAEPAMQQYLREDTTVLATVPNGNLTVAAFSRNLRFTEYHGLVGKPEAAQKRDKAFQAWLAEAVLFHQVRLQKMTDNPRYALMAQRLERNLVLQEALRVLLSADFAPEPAVVEAFYEANLAKFTPSPRVKMESLKVSSHAAAEKLQAELLRGVPASWLKKNNDDVIKGPDPFPREFFEPAKLGLNNDDLTVGHIPEPYQVPSGWVVAMVVEIEKPTAKPLAQCQNELLALMKTEHTRTQMVEILDQLETVAPITIMPDAEEMAAGVMQEFSEQNAVAPLAATPDQED